MVESKKRGTPSHIIINPEKFRLPDGYRPGSGHLSDQKSFTSTRTALHRGHRIKIKTTYRIEIDNEPLRLHTMVMDDGSVHCHGLPNYSFPSAVDLAKSIIDAAGLASIDVDQIGHSIGSHRDDTDERGSQNGHGGEEH